MIPDLASCRFSLSMHCSLFYLFASLPFINLSRKAHYYIPNAITVFTTEQMRVWFAQWGHVMKDWSVNLLLFLTQSVFSGIEASDFHLLLWPQRHILVPGIRRPSSSLCFCCSFALPCSMGLSHTPPYGTPANTPVSQWILNAYFHLQMR